MRRSREFDYVVAIGASAGGIRALQDLISGIDKPLRAPIVVALHSEPKSHLIEVLQRNTNLLIRELCDEELLESGVIYITPGATHAFFRNGHVRLSELVNDSGFRPSIDALFMTMAAEYGAKSIGVVLSGALQDGMRGAQIIYDMGGQTIVQSPDEATYESMPNSIIRSDHPIMVHTAKELGRWLAQYIGFEDDD